MRNEIPRWFWMNGQLNFQLSEALENNSNQSISQFIREFEKSQDINFKFNLKNQGIMLSLLYGLLVVPKEIWEPKFAETTFPFTTSHEFKYNVGKLEKMSDFLRLMRNAVSHAHFEIITNPPSYKFWNINRSGVKDFEVEVSHNTLGKFVEEIGKYYINNVSNRL